jgi:hemerythrin-like metal-binding protein
MPVQNWITRYHTGVKDIDSLHEEIFDLLNEIYGDIIGQTGQVAVGNKIRKLVKITLDHFDDEEAEMRAYAYPEVHAHSAAHQTLRDQLTSLASQIDAGKPAATEALDVMNQYFTQHIKGHDQRWAKFAATK